MGEKKIPLNNWQHRGNDQYKHSTVGPLGQGPCSKLDCNLPNLVNQLPSFTYQNQIARATSTIIISALINKV